MKYYSSKSTKESDHGSAAMKNRPVAPAAGARLPERGQKQEQRPEAHQKPANRLKMPLIIAAALILLAAAAICVPLLSENAAYADGYEVIVNGRPLGVTRDPQAVQQALSSIREEFRQSYGMQIYDDTTLEFDRVKIMNCYMCPPDFYEVLLRQTLKAKVMAWVITVNSRPAVALRTQQEADAVLERILEPYQAVAEDKGRTEIKFLENVEVVNAPAEYGSITDAESAYRIMVYGSADYKEEWHIVVTGETLSSIARKHGLKVADLRKANLSVAATDKIYPGDELLVIAPNNCVNVMYIEYIDRDENYEAEPAYVYNDSMYASEKYVQQQGIPGRRHVNAKTTYVNGIEAEYEIMSATIYEEAVPAVIVKGTRPVPAIVRMAAEGEMAFPLDSYTITSHFGPRDIGSQVADASRFHMGVDLDAGTGTPIYASAAGTVNFAGSSSGYGLLVKISHSGGVETRYGHCSQLLVDKGEKVEKGQLIGLVGNTGTSSGSHCHFEIRINGVPQDPEGRYAGSVPGY